MNVASLELSKRLWELSGWHNGTHWSVPGNPDAVTDFPKYTLGYLLRKLEPLNPSLDYGEDAKWTAETYPRTARFQMADTPENATAKLCVKLFESGVLKRGD